jgi:hypothetical protein
LAPAAAAATFVAPVTAHGPVIELAPFGEMPRFPMMVAEVVQVTAEPAKTA